jgi:nucleotide-binding universal stress UspA family protein
MPWFASFATIPISYYFCKSKLNENIMSGTNQTVLIPIDLADETLPRLQLSYPNLRYLADNIVILYVFDKRHHFRSEEEKSEEMTKRDNQLAEIAKDIRMKTGLEVRQVLQKGKPAEEILKAAESYNANMIVISTHTNPDDAYTESHAIGSTANRIIRESNVPVFSFNSNVQLKRIRKILLPLDLTAETKQKVTNAIYMAKRLNATIAVVSVFYSIKYDDIKEQLEEQLDQVKSFIEEADIQCTAELIEEDGGLKMLPHVILNYAQSVGAELIMIMTQQENKLVEFFMGSSAQTIIRFSKIPVVSIIPKELGFVVGV